MPLEPTAVLYKDRGVRSDITHHVDLYRAGLDELAVLLFDRLEKTDLYSVKSVQKEPNFRFDRVPPLDCWHVEVSSTRLSLLSQGTLVYECPRDILPLDWLHAVLARGILLVASLHEPVTPIKAAQSLESLLSADSTVLGTVPCVRACGQLIPQVVVAPVRCVRMAYPTDLTDEQWDLLEPVLGVGGSRGPQPHTDRRRLVNAILYQARTGCQWRYLPAEFGPWNTACLMA